MYISCIHFGIMSRIIRNCRYHNIILYEYIIFFFCVYVTARGRGRKAMGKYSNRVIRLVGGGRCRHASAVFEATDQDDDDDGDDDERVRRRYRLRAGRWQMASHALRFRVGSINPLARLSPTSFISYIILSLLSPRPLSYHGGLAPSLSVKVSSRHTVCPSLSLTRAHPAIQTTP